MDFDIRQSTNRNRARNAMHRYAYDVFDPNPAGRGSGVLAPAPVNVRHWKIVVYVIRPNASVTSAKYRPFTRSDTKPSAKARNAPVRPAATNPTMKPAPTCGPTAYAALNAPMPTKA